jgi:RNA recognition motif-containing protein
MPEKLFVGGLPFDFTDEQLSGLFAKVATVLAAAMVPDPKNKRTRGFGFVTLPGKQEAEAAIKALNGTKIGEKNIFVTQAKERAPRPAPTPPSFRPPPRDERRPPFGAPRGDRRPPFGGSSRSRGPRSFEGRPSFRPDGPPRARGARPFSSGRPTFRPASGGVGSSLFDGPRRGPGRGLSKPYGSRRPDRPSFGGPRSDRPSFGGPRGPRRAKPAGKPFYQKYSKPGRSTPKPE